MNILFISISYPAEGHRNLYSDLMNEFVENGHNVYVVAAQPDAKRESFKLKNENGVFVLRVPSYPIRKVSHFRKFASLMLLNKQLWRAIQLSIRHINIDLILTHTPPITLSRLLIKLKKRFNAPLYLLLKDIWPQGSVDLNVIRKNGLIWLFLRHHEKQLYKASDHIGCMSPKGVEYVTKHNQYLNAAALEVCPNSIKPTNHFNDFSNRKIREKYKIPMDACIFMFSGNLGIGHGLHFLVDVIKKLRNYPKAFFLIGGNGTQFDYLKKEFKKESIENGLLYNWLPDDDFIQLITASDVGLILLYKYTVPQFPSRLLTYLDNSKPVLCAINQHTDMGKIIQEYNCGFSTEHGNYTEFIQYIKLLSESKELRTELGKNGRKLFLEKYTVSISYETIMKHFTSQ